jgi:N-acetylmuramoyl-L-alanine amidase
MTSKLTFVDRPSPNRDDRPDGRKVDILILHYTGMETAQAAIDRLTDPEARVSAHYTIDEDGTVYRHVPEGRRAWHAGVSHWAGADQVNDRSVGIEIVNPGHEFGYRKFPERQMQSVIALSNEVIERHNIPAARVLGHSDVAPSRKMDPGEKFDWRWLSQEGIGVWLNEVPFDTGPSVDATSAGPEIRRVQSLLADFGYGVPRSGEYDQETTDVVTAFQRHFRQHKVDGIADAETITTLEALLKVVQK